MGNNMFAYCNNDPVNYSDSSGKLPRRNTVFINDGVPSGVQEMLDEVRESKSQTSTKYEPSVQEKIYAATVYAEAGGQNIQSKKAVAHVMNNRIGTRANRTNIEAVISEKYQFDGYNSIMYQEAMNYYNTGVCDNPIKRAAMDECMFVVIPIYNGTESDITGGALYFHSFSDPTQWAYHDDFTQVYVEGTEGFWFYK